MNTFAEITDRLTVTSPMVLQVMNTFTTALSSRSAGYGLKLLDSTFRRPTGQEQGKVLVVDFGGTNLRLLLVDLQGHRTFEVTRQQIINLRQNRSGIDLTSDSAQADQLFDYIADEVRDFIGAEQDYRLGHSFSFPARHVDTNSAFLLEWTKEIKTTKVVGQDVNRLLQAALYRRGIFNIQTRAIINDAVGTLLAGAYSEEVADIGSICGTGHNSCYAHNDGRLINIESGNFCDAVLPVNVFDRQLDDASLHPGTQRFEKMVAGAYLGELFRLILLELGASTDLLPKAIRRRDELAARNCIEASDISVLLQEGKFRVAGNHYDVSEPELSILQDLAARLILRSARLIAATYGGIINHLDPSLQNQHVIIIDGSLLEKMPYFAPAIQATLREIYPHGPHLAQLRFRKDASGIGAAVAAAMT